MKNILNQQLFLTYILILSIIFISDSKAQTENYCGFNEKLQPEPQSGSYKIQSGNYSETKKMMLLE